MGIDRVSLNHLPVHVVTVMSWLLAGPQTSSAMAEFTSLPVSCSARAARAWSKPMAASCAMPSGLGSGSCCGPCRCAAANVRAGHSRSLLIIVHKPLGPSYLEGAQRGAAVAAARHLQELDCVGPAGGAPPAARAAAGLGAGRRGPQAVPRAAQQAASASGLRTGHMPAVAAAQGTQHAVGPRGMWVSGQCWSGHACTAQRLLLTLKFLSPTTLSWYKVPASKPAAPAGKDSRDPVSSICSPAAQMNACWQD